MSLRRRKAKVSLIHRIAAFALAVLLSAQLAYTAYTMKEAHAAGGWTKQSYSNIYLSLNSGAFSGLEHTNGYVHKQWIDSFTYMWTLMSNATAGQSENQSTWGAAWTYAQQLRGLSQVTSLSTVPDCHTANSFFVSYWPRISAAIDAGDSATILSTIQEFAASGNAYFTGNDAINWYLGYTTGADQVVRNAFYNAAGTAGYCAMWKQEFPEGDASSTNYDAEQARTLLGISDAQFKALLNILKRGYPSNIGLENTAYASYPADALQQGTQAAVWAYLNSVGAAGNVTGGTLSTKNNGNFTRAGLANVTDTNLNKNGSTYNVLNYVDYLLNNANTALPSPDIASASMSAFTLNNGYYTSTISVTGSNADQGVAIYLSNVPANSTITANSNNAVTTKTTAATSVWTYKAPESYKSSTAKTSTYTLKIPASSWSGKTITVKAAARSAYSTAAADLLFNYNGSATDQLMFTSEFPVSNAQDDDTITVQADTPTASLTVTKVDNATTPVPVANCEFELFYAGTSLGKKTTGTNGVISWTGLQAGATYALRETNAPAGYVKMADAQIVTSTATLSNTYTATNEIIKVEVSKTDFVYGTDVPGATLEIRKADTNEIVKDTVTGADLTWTTDGTPHLINRMEPGNYLLIETRTPFGYQIAETGEFTVTASGVVQTVEMIDDETYGNLTITKTDSTTGAALSGVKFELRYKTDVTDRSGAVIYAAGSVARDAAGNVVGEMTTNADGKATLATAVPIGTYDDEGWNAYIEYQLVETENPNGQYTLIDPIDIEFTYVDENTPIIMKTFAISNDGAHVSFEKHGSPATFEGDYTAATRDEITVVDAGDEITYTIKVENTGASSAYNIIVKDAVPEHTTFAEFKASRWEATTDADANTTTTSFSDNTCYWIIDELEAGQTVYVEYSVTVDAIPANNVWDIVNVAYVYVPNQKTTDPEDPTDPAIPWEPTEEVVHRTEIKPNYEMDKVRITDAPIYVLEDGSFGFWSTEWVTYQSSVTNTGNVDLTMNLKDEYEAAAATYFADITYISVSGEGVTWNNETESKNTSVEPNITVAAGKTATIVIKARVTEEALQYLAPTTADDKTNASDGYVNTVTVYDVTGTYSEELPDPDNTTDPQKKITVDVTITKNEYPDELGDKHDTANTPVQICAPNYEMDKVRVTEAPAKDGTGEYGFYHDDVVTYQSTIKNTGNVILTMDVKDEYEEIAKEYFDMITYVSVSGDGVTWNNEAESKGTSVEPNITLEIGATATIVITAHIDPETPEYLAPTAADDRTNAADGYINTVTTYNVTGSYTLEVDDPDNNWEKKTVEHIVTAEEYPVELGDKSDDANTPVQIRVSYEMNKVRVDDAAAKEGTEEFGFRRGDTVTYKSTIKNTGEAALTMDVKDEYEEAASKYFENIIYVSVTGSGVTWNNEEESKGTSVEPNITIEGGKTAIVTIKATITKKAEELLAPTAADDRDNAEDGYVNTVTTYNVTAEYEVCKIDETTGKKTITTTEFTKDDNEELVDKSDDANTPVQVVIGKITGKTDRNKNNTPTKVLGIDYSFQWQYILLLIAALVFVSTLLAFLARINRKEK